MAGPGAIGGAAGGAAAAPAAIAAPDILGLNKGEDTSLAYKDGEYTPDAVQRKILEGIQAFSYVKQQLGDSDKTTLKQFGKKNKELAKKFTEGFHTSPVVLNQYGAGLKSVIEDLKKRENKQLGLADVVKELDAQLKVIGTLTKSHELFAKGNYTIDQALKSGKGWSLIDSSLKLMYGTDPRQRALGTIEALKSMGSKHIDGLLVSRSYKSKIDAQQLFLKSPAAQAVTKALAGQARTMMQNANSAHAGEPQYNMAA